MASRIHAFDALDNFRDYGDYATTAGGHVRPGVLYRSAHHAGVSEGDLERLAALDFGVVIDLRRPVERRRQPSKRAPNFSGVVIESDHDEVGEAPHITFLKTSDLTPESGRQFMTATYRELPFAPAHLDLFSRYFRALAESDRPVLIHCAAGKDRTGMLAALTHHLLGVSGDDLMEDYLLTNTAVDLEARAPGIAEQMKAFTGRTASHDAVVAFMGVEAAYLHAAIAAMVERYGSIDAYLERALGVDAGLRDRIVERLSA
ncbi:protein tyrosine phosphatase [Brevundimonas sp. AAP58]|uniref:tyrosine-protein phosphatase n=1 Tax=Brevundimonas sp. AAP58 TaxID=1523422 RepID=UPI0006B9E749|nr:tyrosine-protein phosphatase [Brevundimonas sp. AAP58]KPF81009.1 protein tyrosine phosphatase [Brevundimonas sp. AAP58]